MMNKSFSDKVGFTGRVWRTERGQGHRISSDHSKILRQSRAFMYGDIKGDVERRK